MAHINKGPLLSVFLLAVTPTSLYAAGPDVIVGFVDNGREAMRSGSAIGLTASTNSCNAGDAPLQWWGLPDNRHPVISLNLYRLTDDRIEQIARSWVKHGFFAVNALDCADIAGIQKHCNAAGGGNQLMPGCSDLYKSDLNSNPNMLGPRSKIDPTTGKFTGANPLDLTGYPASQIVDRVMQVDEGDLKVGGARYFLESQYITSDDAAAGNARNNVTFRDVSPILQGGQWLLQNDSTEVRGQPAVTAWKTSGAKFSEMAIAEGGGDINAYILVGYKATPIPNNSFRYDYVVYNMNSDAAVHAFTVPCGEVDETSIGFSAPASHGEIWSNLAWDHKVSAGTLVWTTESFQANPNANAIRWGTTYHFWFNSKTAPTPSNATIDRFKQVDPQSISINVLAPG